MTTSKFPRPWRVEEVRGGFVVKDANDAVVARTEYKLEGSGGLSRWQARLIADRMLEAADVVAAHPVMKD